MPAETSSLPAAQPPPPPGRDEGKRPRTRAKLNYSDPKILQLLVEAVCKDETLPLPKPKNKSNNWEKVKANFVAMLEADRDIVVAPAPATKTIKLKFLEIKDLFVE
eukprot:scaffold309407_cov36-Prasinocladus_malaysianus.AAC.1